MFQKVLIANRGEIAVRIIRTLQELGVRTVAIYSVADKDAVHVRMADESVCVGPPPAKESYLDFANIMAAADITGCDAIHPGYGFLSENHEFAEVCAQTGLAFIGPSADLIHRMGDKVEARKLVRAAGGPVVPGKDLGPDATVQEAAKAAEEIGFPIMIKARGGGGGKGMKVVHAPGDFADAFNLARTEAERAFGNAAVYLEKRLERARHVEIQVLGDKHGNVVHLGERDCSIQRRFQKVIEEARAPAMPQRVVDEMAASAAALARNIGYDSAGTLEFLVDRDHHFYFLEMNTRIQVEHPVTEMITGVDLVKGQVLVAAGEKLPIAQQDVRFTGHAVECRVLAEDFETGRPSTGRVRGLHSPGGLGVRVESAVVSGTEISPYYDPMIMKIIAHGEDRDHAIARMKVALLETSILGFKTNLPWLLKAIDHPEFRAGRADTTFFERCKL